MLGKLLKHEFTATGRLMLPVLGVLAGLIVLANISVRVMERDVGGLLTILAMLVLIAAFIAVILAELLPIIVMVLRFYRNLLGNEGYLMHTLPVNVHELIWSKLIVSLVWILATNLAIFLLGALSVLFQSGTSLAELFQAFPSLSELRDMLPEIRNVDIWTFLVEMVTGILLAGMITCLHFYAAMSLGHMFSKDKVLFSILFFIGIDVAFNILSTILGLSGVYYINGLTSFAAAINTILSTIGLALLALAIRGAILYVLTVLGLRKGLNLA